jgi:hypothetical protein
VSAAAAYAERVDAVLAQRTRLRGPQPPGDLFAGVPPDHPLLVSDPRRPLDANLAVLASYVGPDDVVIDVGGGGGRFSGGRSSTWRRRGGRIGAAGDWGRGAGGARRRGRRDG